MPIPGRANDLGGDEKSVHSENLKFCTSSVQAQTGRATRIRTSDRQSIPTSWYVVKCRSANHEGMN